MPDSLPSGRRCGRSGRAGPAPVTTRVRRTSARAQVPWGLDLAAAWAWRLLVIAGGDVPAVSPRRLLRGGHAATGDRTSRRCTGEPRGEPCCNGSVCRRGLASILVVVGFLGAVGLLLTFAGQQVASGANDLADSTVRGLGEIKTWLKDGPLNASDSQIDGYIQDVQDTISEQTADSDWFSQATQIGSTLGHVFAGFFIILFATFFFLADGDRIWAWIVRIAPARGTRAGRQLGAGRLDLADPVRASHGDRRGRRRARHHDRRSDLAGAVRAGDRSPGLPRRLRAPHRCHGRGSRRHLGGAGRPRARSRR